MIDTCETLLGRLRVENAHDAWKEFYHLYWASILSYARRLGLNSNEAEEVLQETMVTLMRILPQFAYDPEKGSFRNFLLTIVHRKSLAIIRRKQRNRLVSLDSDGKAGSLALAASNDPDAVSLTLWRESLVEEALRRLREESRINAATYAIFHCYVLEKQPVEEIVRTFGVSVNAVHQIRNRLIRKLQLEVAKLMKSSGSPDL